MINAIIVNTHVLPCPKSCYVTVTSISFCAPYPHWDVSYPYWDGQSKTLRMYPHSDGVRAQTWLVTEQRTAANVIDSIISRRHTAVTAPSPGYHTLWVCDGMPVSVCACCACITISEYVLLLPTQCLHRNITHVGLKSLVLRTINPNE